MPAKPPLSLSQNTCCAADHTDHHHFSFSFSSILLLPLLCLSLCSVPVRAHASEQRATGAVPHTSHCQKHFDTTTLGDLAVVLREQHFQFNSGVALTICLWGEWMELNRKQCRHTLTMRSSGVDMTDMIHNCFLCLAVIFHQLRSTPPNIR